MMPLAMVSENEVVRLVALRGGRGMNKRLADMGLNVGMTVRVVRCIQNGPMILDVKDSRLAIGRGMAHHLMVEIAK
jgi:ferrous iron transport protein A